MKQKLLIILFSLILFACASPIQYLDSHPANTLKPAPQGKAQMVFLRPSGLWAGMPAYFVEVNPTTGEKNLLGILQGRDQYVVDIIPGEHHYIVTDGAHIGMVKLNAEPGKRYYALARPVYAAGYKLRPIRTDGTTDYNSSIKAFQKWLKKDIKVMNSEADLIREPFQKNIDRIYNLALTYWNSRTDAQKSELTFRAEDGISIE